MKKKEEKSSMKSLDQFVDEQYGKKGTEKREKFERGFEEFKLGVLIRQIRLEKGLTQEQLAERAGTNKGYISKVENDVKDVRLSTLRRIIEQGLGGHLDLSIKI
ncbi:helix-turn-helix domain-containing protein [Prolixibacter sp. NT017]|uniref:helix-turn-helix domain-containing protein n=1 Tax=Prolixibacter sp. NT017 TaxID=2652390 RepID=UPI00126F03EC|nr:helix-turn-helix transcriptional regulator [Prolixibacter sp. NT017]GET25507.1 transcriptional regulator [Prolixibacter sp. NT017]